MKRNEPKDSGPLLTTDELRLLVGLLGSPLHKVLQKVLHRFKEDDQIALVRRETDFPTTQYHRGRLAFLADLVLLLEDQAPKEYEQAKKSTKEPSP